MITFKEIFEKMDNEERIKLVLAYITNNGLEDFYKKLKKGYHPHALLTVPEMLKMTLEDIIKTILDDDKPKLAKEFEEYIAKFLDEMEQVANLIDLNEILEPIKELIDDKVGVLYKKKLYPIENIYKLLPIKAVYIIALEDKTIPYPKKEHNIIYIGRTLDKKTGLKGRIKSHVNGGNIAIKNYCEIEKCIVIYYIPDEEEYKKNHEYEEVQDDVYKGIEQLAILYFENVYGCKPICNNQAPKEGWL